MGAVGGVGAVAFAIFQPWTRLHHVEKPLESLETKVESLETTMETKMESLETKMDTKMDSLRSEMHSGFRSLEAAVASKPSRTECVLGFTLLVGTGFAGGSVARKW